MIEYFARNRVAANLLMASVCVLGLVSAFNRLTLEVFPSVEADVVNVRVFYPGSTPTESEEAIGIRIEEAIQDLEGIDRLYTNATEGLVTVTAEVIRGYDPRELLDDIKNRVDSISTFPEDAERPVIEQPAISERVLNIVLSGPLTETDLKKLGERIREEITNLPGVTQVGLRGARPYEIAIEVSEKTLQAYNLTFADVATAIRRSSVDLSAGRIRTAGGDILLRTDAQAYVQEEFEEIVVRTDPNGTRITLADISEVRDGFDENVMYSEFNGNRAVMVDVFRVGDQDVIEIARTVKDYLERSQSTLPEGVSLNIWNDWSETIRDRLDTLSGSLLWGGLLVFLILAMFLRFSVAIFVAIGVPVSFLGGLALMPLFDITLNLLSMFAFIMVLGIVVDDAIVTGENIFNHLRRRKGSATDAAIAGTKEVSVPVTFGVITTMIAFVPLMLLPGRRGEFFSVIAVIVIIVLAFSLVQSKLVLPAHMSYLVNIGKRDEKLNFLQRFQRIFSDGLEWFIRNIYRKLLHVAIKHRYSTAAFFIVIFMIMIAMLSTGRLKFFFFPRVENDWVTVRLEMPIGTPVEVTERYVMAIADGAQKVKDDFNSQYGDGTVRNMLMTVGGQPFGSRRSGGASGQSHLGEMILELAPGEIRNPAVSAFTVSQAWRKNVGVVPGGEVSYIFSRASGGAPIDVQLSGPDFEQLDLLAADIKEQLTTYPGVVDIVDSFESGKDEIKLKLKPAATNLGLTSQDLARQVRQAFFGLEAQRIQRGRDDVRVMVRYPQDERRSLENLENMRIRTPDGYEVPFSEVAIAEMGKSLPSIRRVDRNRTLNITADIEEGKGDVEAVKADLVQGFLPALLASHPEVSFSLEGEAREQRESFESLRYGILLVLFGIYMMLAIVFRSYLQPFIVMLIIPFSIVGAIAFHLVRGDTLSIMSILGILALIGVVVNDSLVLVDYVNRHRKQGFSLLRAVSYAGIARFRPILLTSLTTIGGLTPLLLEKSRQAQWLIPMAVSLAGGIAFATFITLFLVPIVYLIFEDIAKGARRAWNWWRG
ncbi:efflux RND transporter permease subunit [Puniceicoccales bacterium CK1056]|uniref:Efflux RND transporter permease subunit n=1 Tax=Oceanipulchritudo coccoides TaxID=2706888 RepID=A0A6B2LYR7_9BACT|nr:efflux RND transporter permease subunit [Oceanipulchritudo coccoides]NDV60907.1 efflux RND transporter permease subunit [Oceanipulchritudo coccoides]